ncbi:antitoxin Xre/MbcA/ParS toxin-binding domain-containing protein [Halodurantibacterium flavum]|uniref:Antitoxin Xre/MbcA/ParS toxin-binding domain-containing protein n=1 Tax=Halodurantibacterium flavum TaxID=1382802 RepID=A0ABW4S9L0_9RHOB
MQDRRPVRQRLTAHYTSEEIAVWMHRAHPQLGDQSPRHLIHQGRAEEVHRVIDRLDDGAYI